MKRSILIVGVLFLVLVFTASLLFWPTKKWVEIGSRIEDYPVCYALKPCVTCLSEDRQKGFLVSGKFYSGYAPGERIDAELHFYSSGRTIVLAPAMFNRIVDGKAVERVAFAEPGTDPFFECILNESGLEPVLVKAFRAYIRLTCQDKERSGPCAQPWLE